MFTNQMLLAGATAPSGGSFSPADLFASGEEGFWYDAQDLSTQWEDDGKVTAASEDSVVGYIADKSGTGTDVSTGATANKPILRLVDGVYHWEVDSNAILAGSGSWSATDPFHMFVCASITGTSANDGLFFIGDGATSNAQRAVGIQNNITLKVDTRGSDARASGVLPNINVLEGRFDASDAATDFISAAFNGGAFTTTDGTVNALTVNDVSLFKGVTNNTPEGDYYSFLLINRWLTSDERSDLVSYMQTAAGI